MFFDEKYDVVIVGGGVTGSALLFALANYTDIKKLALIEKHKELAYVNSHYNNNSQTLHFGDIETNYTLEKAKKVKEAAEMMVNYIEKYGKDCFFKGYKMALAVGDKEVADLEKRFEEFKETYPRLKKIGREELREVEPKIVEGRKPGEKLLALCTDQGYAVNYKCLSESFVKNALAVRKRKKIDLLLNWKVRKILKKKDVYKIVFDDRMLTADVVVVAAGAHSLIFAKRLGYGKEYGILPVAGSFYSALNVLKSKVYTMQTPKLPFASVHGDPNVANPSEMRFGPTTKVLPLLERHNYWTIFDFLRTSVWSIEGVLSLIKIISDKTIFLFVLKNLLYDVPVSGKWFYLKACRKIVPSLKYNDLHYADKIGGIRPQAVNVKTKKLEMGVVKIVGDKIIFDITPSPGASASLKNAEQDVLKVMEFLPHFSFDRKRWCEDFGSSLSVCEE